MSVLIKGMEMPRNCYECKVWFECFEEKPPFNMIKSVCPLVEVKEPHGRLIDADTIPSFTVNLFRRDADLIAGVPTVIEAEDGT